MSLEDRIREQAKGTYYCNLGEEGEECLWEPFEYWPEEDIESQIEDDTSYWLDFIEKEIAEAIKKAKGGLE